jgi:hypothetical protein
MCRYLVKQDYGIFNLCALVVFLGFFLERTKRIAIIDMSGKCERVFSLNRCGTLFSLFDIDLYLSSGIL